jgi:DNA-directed RNA polymerase beta' subunit
MPKILLKKHFSARAVIAVDFRVDMHALGFCESSAIRVTPGSERIAPQG